MKVIFCTLTLLLICFGATYYFCGVDDSLYTPFEEVCANSINITFKNVWVRNNRFGFEKRDIRLYPQENKQYFDVRVNRHISATVLSVYPSMYNRFFGYFIKAQLVVVWVANEKEKETWDKYLQNASKKIFLALAEKKRKPKARKILPACDD